ncbi:DUF3592 domain-containing protein [Marinifilum sp. N1E240]|uniref:DUF3592 domain-containing protein n=1 Tax=Marinifilum sp. N1E240 TaxID=2608082 RepID=UPI00128C9D33|nr:DUF3592 domain-containing protein [Marinifilum sp. N1E240]MPQ45718.1 DUF3592 domain-containing protein [Marinifilum sp. N1E240]
MEHRQNSPIGLFIFALVFIVGGWLFYKNISESIVKEAEDSKTWPSVEGVISYSDLRRSISDGDEMFAVDLEYNYFVKGAKHAGNRISAIDGSSSNKSGVIRDLQEYPVGKKVMVFYDPEIPSISLLKPGANLFTYFVKYGPLLFCFIGVLMLFQVIKKIIVFAIALFVGLKN